MSTDECSVAIFDLERFQASAPPTLVLENYGAGWAWLRPTEPGEDDEALYVPTERGLDQVDRWAAERSLFGQEVS